MSEEVAPLCLNCRAALTGPWCANCGQKHEPEIHTFAHFAGEAFENITHADSRVWRTVWVLVSKPGCLTREFFSGRRGRYLPPVRLYLVVSLVFFLLAGLADNQQEPAVIVDRADTAGAEPGKGEAAGKACSRFSYNGPFKDAVMALVHKKVEAGESHAAVEPARQAPSSKSADIYDLTELLQRSLGKGKASPDAQGTAKTPTSRAKPAAKRSRPAAKRPPPAASVKSVT